MRTAATRSSSSAAGASTPPAATRPAAAGNRTCARAPATPPATHPVSTGARPLGLRGLGERVDLEDGRALEAAVAQVVERLVGGVERVARDLRADRDARREREELLAVAPREIGDGADGPFVPQVGVGDRRQVAHVDAG